MTDQKERKKQATVERDAYGRFAPGSSGNPNGRPAVPPAIREAAKEYSWEAIDLLAEVIRDPEETSAARILAAKQLLKVSGYNLPAEVSGIRNLSDATLGRLLDQAISAAQSRP